MLCQSLWAPTHSVSDHILDVPDGFELFDYSLLRCRRANHMDVGTCIHRGANIHSLASQSPDGFQNLQRAGLPVENRRARGHGDEMQIDGFLLHHLRQ